MEQLRKGEEFREKFNRIIEFIKKFLKKWLMNIRNVIERNLPVLKIVYETRETSAPITFRTIFFQKILGFNRNAYWPMHFTSVAGPIKNILVGIGTAPGLSPGCYIQAIGKIYIGNYTLIAPNVGIISANHDIYNPRTHLCSTIRIGNYCWIGMNTIILPGVQLGDFTVVGAGSVVTKSFTEGYCMIGGNPAAKIMDLEKDRCKKYCNKYEFIGYIRKNDFKKYREKKLHI